MVYNDGLQRWTSYLAGLLFLLTTGPETATGQASSGPTGTLAGRVLETRTQSLLPAVNVQVQDSTWGTATNEDGRYRIEDLPVGTYAIRYSMVGYKPVVKTSVVITSGATRHVNVTLQRTVVEAEEVNVTADYFDEPMATSVSVRSLHEEEISRAPGAAGDVQRVMHSMPGVAFTDDHRNDLIVRGGSPMENRILVDGITVPNINHFGTQGATGGPISMINTDFLDEATFLTGGFPAEYGGKLSSVLNIRLREGNRSNVAGTFDLSMAGAGMSIEGPMPGEQEEQSGGSWFVGARRLYLDLIHQSIDLTAVPEYSNAQAKAVYDINQQNRLSLIGLWGTHSIHFENRDEDIAFEEDEELKTTGDLMVGGLTWRHLWNDVGYANVTLSTVSSTYHTDLRVSENRLMYRNRSRETTTSLDATSSWTILPHGTIEAGGALRLVDYHHDLIHGLQRGSPGPPGGTPGC